MVQLKANEDAAKQHFEKIKGKLTTRITNVLKGRVPEKNGHPVTISAGLRTFLYSHKTESHLRTLVTASPNVLPGIISYIASQHPEFFDVNDDSNFVLKNIFIANCYESLDKLTFIKRLTLDTCPYCNRNYIYYTSEQNKIKPQLDHFYPKDKYPFLGVSFYNLIPSCQTCNGLEVKSSTDSYQKGLVNPYLLTNDSFKFSYEIADIDAVNSLKANYGIEITFVNKVKSHLDVFKLDKLYQQHADHVLELIVKSKLKYSNKYREYLISYSELGLSDKEIDRMILGNYTDEEEIHKRPLAKLYQDIGKELGLITK